MRRKRAIILGILSFLVAATLVLVMVVTISNVRKTSKETCFAELCLSARDIADKLFDQMQSDRLTLAAIAQLLGTQDALTDAQTTQLFRTYTDELPVFSHLVLLTPDGRLLDNEGKTADATGVLDFEQERLRGAYLSSESVSIYEPDKNVLRASAPVERNGKTVAIVYGVLSLEHLATQYPCNLYNGSAQVYLIDGDTGDFLIDTWHPSPGNIHDFGSRDTVDGSNWQHVTQQLLSGEEGGVGFISETTGEVFYMQYTPVGINNWSLVLTVAENAALSSANGITKTLSVTCVLLVLVLAAYMLIITASLYRAYRTVYRQGREDQITGLQNRTAYETYISNAGNRVFECVTCIFLDINGLHAINNRYGHAAGDQMLQTLATLLKQAFPYSGIYRVGGDEFVVLSFNPSPDACTQAVQSVSEQMQQHDYSLSYGVACRQNEAGLLRVIKEADEKMLENKREYYRLHDRREARKS